MLLAPLFLEISGKTVLSSRQTVQDEDEMDMQEMEAAREAYVSAVAAAKANQDERSISDAANARFQLQSIVLK